MLRCCRVAAWLLAWLASAGCESPSPPPPYAVRPGRPPGPSPAPSPAPAPVTVVTVPEPIVVAPPQPILAEPLITNEPPAQPQWPANWVRGWVPLANWCKFNGLAAPVRVQANPSQAWEVRTPHGLMRVGMDQRALRFDGVECWLAYAPQVVRGQPCVYAFDAQKTLQPLVSLGTPPGPAGRTLVLDPGHGGKDAGAQSAFNKESEKAYTLDWALRVQRLLATNGWTVWLTRTNDQDVSLLERVAAAERAHADLFLSLHFNAGLNSHDRAGLETYCLTPVGLPSHVVRNHEEDPGQAYPNNAFDDQNLQWAFRVHRALLAAGGEVDHGVRRARFMGVLRGQKRPAVLIEAGYLSNAAEARRIATAQYRQRLAEAVAKALE